MDKGESFATNRTVRTELFHEYMLAVPPTSLCSVFNLRRAVKLIEIKNATSTSVLHAGGRKFGRGRRSTDCLGEGVKRFFRHAIAIAGNDEKQRDALMPVTGDRFEHRPWGEHGGNVKLEDPQCGDAACTLQYNVGGKSARRWLRRARDVWVNKHVALGIALTVWVPEIISAQRAKAVFSAACRRA